MLERAAALPGLPEETQLRLDYAVGDLAERDGDRDEARQRFAAVVAREPEAFDAAERLAALDAPPGP